MSELRAIACVVSCLLLCACGIRSFENDDPDDALSLVIYKSNTIQDVEPIKKALRNGAKPDTASKLFHNSTPLGLAVSYGWVEAVDVLLKGGADPNFCPQNENSEVINACPLTGLLYEEADRVDRERDVRRQQIVKLLLSATAQRDGDWLDQNPLAVAILAGKLDIADILLAAGASPLGSKNHVSPLGAAIASGQTEFTKRLIQAGASLQQIGRGPAKDAALFIRAAENRDAGAIAIFIEAGLDPYPPNQCAGMYRCSFVVDSPLRVATTSGCDECVKQILEAGARFELFTRNASGEYETYDRDSLFMQIGKAGKVMLDAYLAHGLDLHARNGDKQTLLHVAAVTGKAESIKWFVKHGIDVDAVDHNGQTPLMLAAANGRIEIVQASLDAKANVALLDTAGFTAKVLAFGIDLDRLEYQPGKAPSTAKYVQVVQLLEPHGATEYGVDHLPSSNFDGVLAGLNQRDLTGYFYRALPPLPAGLRFFAAYNAKQRSSTFDKALPSTLFFVVHPGDKVDKFVEPQDLLRVGLQLRSSQDVLALVRFLSGDGRENYFLQDTPYFHMRFQGSELGELPENSDDSCFSYSLEPVNAAGIKHLSVEVINNRKEKYFVVIRLMIPRASFYDSSISQVTRVSERVTPNGSYSMSAETIATPGLNVEHCRILL
jgi:ankyrin repeat protein